MIYPFAKGGSRTQVPLSPMTVLKRKILYRKTALALVFILVITALSACGSTSKTDLLEDKSTSDSETDSSSEVSELNTSEESKVTEEQLDKEVSKVIESIYANSSDGERAGLSSVIESIENSVVAINVTGTVSNYFYSYPTEGSGSGVIISEDGYIVTNNHVITGGNGITVFLNNGDTYNATLVGADDRTDIAVLKIEGENLSAAKWGVSSTLRVGDYAIAIGNPLGEYQGTVTFGIVSALNRDITIDGETMNMFQVDAAVNPGNSGGGLFDSNGTLIGIVSAKSSVTTGEGLGFVLPIDSIKPIVSDIIQYGYVTGRPTLGFKTADITSMASAAFNGVNWIGVYVNGVTKGSNAETAGLQFRDYIASVDGESIKTSDRLYEILESKSVGDTLVLEIWRNNLSFDVILIIEEEKN